MKADNDDSAFWISYSDLATSLMLVFILLFTLMAKRTQDVAATKNAEIQKQLDENRIQKQEMGRRKATLVNLREEATHLLGVHERLSSQLERAVAMTNQQLGRSIFQFADGEVYVSDQEVAWFRSNSAQLLPEAQEQIKVFYRNLFDHLLRDVEGNPVIETHLESITIEGHTDPLPIRAGVDKLWTLTSYNGTSRSEHGSDSNLQLGQQRAKAIMDLIHESYVQNVDGFDSSRPWHLFFALAQASGRSWTRAYCGEEGRVASRPLNAHDVARGWPLPCAQVAMSAEDAANRRSRRVTFSFALDTRALLLRLKERLDFRGGYHE